MIRRVGAFVSGLSMFATAVMADKQSDEYTLQDFNTKMFWKRPQMGKSLI